jgi:hypothetical protein
MCRLRPFIRRQTRHQRILQRLRDHPRDRFRLNRPDTLGRGLAIRIPGKVDLGRGAARGIGDPDGIPQSAGAEREREAEIGHFDTRSASAMLNRKICVLDNRLVYGPVSI